MDGKKDSKMKNETKQIKIYMDIMRIKLYLRPCKPEKWSHGIWWISILLVVLFSLNEVSNIYTYIYVYICDQVYQRHEEGRWYFPGTPVSSTNKTDATIQLKYCWK